MSKKIIRGIGIVLPQFHQILENDIWWGEGFTEWTNSEKAKPLFVNHYQPHQPHRSIGNYNLNTIEAIAQQVNIAKQSGMYGLCYYHYWFNGKMLLERPVQLLIEHKEVEIPFMLCWANENWTRAWDGADKEILMEQKYSLDDDKLHMTMLCEKYFSDNRYIKINNAPVFCVYRHQNFPNSKATVAMWQEVCTRYGFAGIYLIAVENHFSKPVDPKSVNFNANMMFPLAFGELKKIEKAKGAKRLVQKILGKKYIGKNVIEYKTMVDYYKNYPYPNYTLFPSVTPSWDNSARRKILDRSFVLHNSTPQHYQDLLQHTYNNFMPKTSEENFIFINAMNEWAEGNHIEPCKKWGFAYMEATKNVFN